MSFFKTLYYKSVNTKPVLKFPASGHFSTPELTTMDNLHNRLRLDLGKKNKIFYHSKKEDPKINKIAEFGGKML